MPKVVIAPDSFKESLSAVEVCNAITKGLVEYREFDIKNIPIADGGEGTTDALVRAVGGEKIIVPTVDPLGRLINGFFGILPDRTVVIEVAAASGLHLLAKDERNPLKTSSLGTGLIIKNAIEEGFDRFIITLGGSATNDGGTGIVQAMGGKIRDRDSRELGHSPESLTPLAEVDLSGIPSGFFSAEFTVACDVDNLLLGQNGASYVYGPQKGATPDSIIKLEAFLERWVNLLESKTGRNLRTVKGTGAAGGMALPFLAFTDARLRRGFEIVKELTGLEEEIQGADLVISGEGMIDEQTFSGKTVKGVIDLCRKHNKKLVLFAGAIKPGILDAAGENMHAYSLSSVEPDKEKSVKNAAAILNMLVRQTAKEFIY